MSLLSVFYSPHQYAVLKLCAFLQIAINYCPDRARTSIIGLCTFSYFGRMLISFPFQASLQDVGGCTVVTSGGFSINLTHVNLEKTQVLSVVVVDWKETKSSSS